eukprot:1156108-Pelagomonas_calceolata.AAC.2
MSAHFNDGGFLVGIPHHVCAYTRTHARMHRYGYLWRILRWIAAYADMPGPGPKLSVQAAADEIERLDARYDCDNNNEVIFFEDWNMKMETAQKKNKVSLTAHSRLQEKEFFYLHAWKRSGQSVNYGNRQVDRMEQLVQGCNVQV